MSAQIQFPLVPLHPVIEGRGVFPHRHSQEWKGLGATITGGAATADQIATLGASTTVAILTPLLALGPLGAAIGGLVAVAGAVASLFGGCGQSCIISSDDANKVGDYMAQNMNAYLSAPTHYASMQKAALNNFDTAWQSLVAACSNPQLGSAGQRCISDRQQGSCKWTASPGGWQQQNGKWVYVPWGPAGSGTACWNYFVGMRDPISQDPTVVPDPPSLTATGPGATGSTSGTGGGAFNFQELVPLLLIVGGALVVLTVL